MNAKLLSLTTACILLPALALTPVQAEIYKWTDSNGVVQYTQTPPPADTAKVKEIAQDISLSSGKALKQTEAMPDSAAPDSPVEAGADLEKARADGKKNEVKHQEFCEQQRGALKQLLANPVIRWKSTDEAEHILTAKERTDKIAQFEKSITDMCNDKVLSTKAVSIQ